VDVLNSDFRCKWPSKNNFSELDISQSLDWQCPSLSPYFLLKPLYLVIQSLNKGTQFSHPVFLVEKSWIHGTE